MTRDADVDPDKCAVTTWRRCLEKRHGGRVPTGGSTGTTTSIVMPSGLVEGTDTIVLYSVLLAVPDRAVWWCWLTAVLVAVTVLQRLRWARRQLR